MTDFAKLGALVSIKGGGTPDRSNPEYWGGDVPWVTVKDFKSLSLSGAAEHITQKGLAESASNLIPAGSIIVPTRMAVGKAAINEVDVAINQDLKAITVDRASCVDRDFLFRFLLSKSAYLESQGKGATVKGITLDVLRDLDVPVPPKAEQQRIAAILDKADSIRSKRQEAIQLTNDLLRAVFIDMYGDPVINPKGWPVYKMGDVIDFKGGSQPSKETFVDEERPGHVRLVQIRDFKTEKYKTFIPAHLAKRAFDVDDVMIARYGPPVFQILRGLSGSYNVALMKAQPKADILKEIIYWLLQLPAYHDVVVANSERTAGQSGVNLDLLNKLLVPLPPPSVQLEIAKQTTRITALIKKQEEMLRLQEAQCKALQASLLG